MGRKRMSSKEVKTLREFMGWSQAEMADQLGVNQSTVSHWETGARNVTGPTQRLLELMAKENSKKIKRRVLQSR